MVTIICILKLWVKTLPEVISLLTWPGHSPFFGCWWLLQDSKCPNGDSIQLCLFIYLFGSNVFCMYFCFSPFHAEPKNMHEEDGRMTCWWCFSEWLAHGRLSWDVGFAPRSVKLSPLWACLQFLWKRTIGSICLHQVQVQVCPHMKRSYKTGMLILADLCTQYTTLK